MKKLIILAVSALLITAGYSQVSDKSSTLTTYTFKLKEVVDLGKLADGPHTYISEQGEKLVITIKKNQVLSARFFTAGGNEISKSADSPVKTNRGCQVCFPVQMPNGTRTNICYSAQCTAEQINKALQ